MLGVNPGHEFRLDEDLVRGFTYVEGGHQQLQELTYDDNYDRVYTAPDGEVHIIHLTRGTHWLEGNIAELPFSEYQDFVNNK